MEMEVTDSRTASLAELTRSRKQIDSDAQLLSNRIKLLQLEAQKTLKKVEETRRKALVIRQIKRRERAQLHISDQLRVQREQLVSQKHERNAQLREDLKLQHHKSLEALMQRKRRQAMAVKTQLLSDRQKKSFIHIRLQEVNFARVKGIQQDRQEAQIRVKSHQIKKRVHLKGNYYERMEEEDRRMKEREQAVVEMELVEMELIERLKTTQRMQKTADEELQSAFSRHPRSLNSR
jgi:hypothetical protein